MHFIFISLFRAPAAASKRVLRTACTLIKEAASRPRPRLLAGPKRTGTLAAPALPPPKRFHLYKAESSLSLPVPSFGQTQIQRPTAGLLPPLGAQHSFALYGQILWGGRERFGQTPVSIGRSCRLIPLCPELGRLKQQLVKFHRFAGIGNPFVRLEGLEQASV